MTNGSSEGRLEVKNFDFQFVTCEHAGLNGGDVDRPGFGWFLHVPIPFAVMPVHCAAERRSLDTMRQQSHFRNRRCLAGCRRRLGRAFALKPAEEASSITLQIGGRGSRDRHPLPDRPPTLQAFRSVHSRTPSVSTQRLINGSRSYLRCHGVQSRRAPL